MKYTLIMLVVLAMNVYTIWRLLDANIFHQSFLFQTMGIIWVLFGLASLLYSYLWWDLDRKNPTKGKKNDSENIP